MASDHRAGSNPAPAQPKAERLILTKSVLDPLVQSLEHDQPEVVRVYKRAVPKMLEQLQLVFNPSGAGPAETGVLLLTPEVASKLYTEAYTFITGKKQDKEPGKADMQNLLKNIRRNTCFANGKNLLDKILTKKYRDGLILLLYNEQPFQYSTKDHYPHPEEAGLLFLFAAAVPFILEEDKTVQVTVEDLQTTWAGEDKSIAGFFFLYHGKVYEWFEDYVKQSLVTTSSCTEPKNEKVVTSLRKLYTVLVRLYGHQAPEQAGDASLGQLPGSPSGTPDTATDKSLADQLGGMGLRSAGAVTAMQLPGSIPGMQGAGGSSLGQLPGSSSGTPATGKHMEGSSAGIGMASMGMEGAHEDDRPPTKEELTARLNAQDPNAENTMRLLASLSLTGLHGVLKEEVQAAAVGSQTLGQHATEGIQGINAQLYMGEIGSPESPPVTNAHTSLPQGSLDPVQRALLAAMGFKTSS